MDRGIRNIPWRLISFICLGVLALVGVGMLMRIVNQKDQKQVCTSLKVMVEGKETFIDQHDISNLIKNKFGTVVGINLDQIPVQEIEDALTELPYVSKAEIYADMNGVLQVSVGQREVVLRVINKAGSEYYVDTEGAKIPVTLKYVPHVLVANGHIAEGYKKPLDTVESRIVTDLLRIVAHVKNDPLWSNQIVQLYVNENKDIEIIPRVGNQELILGNADSLTQKLDRLVIFYKNILPKVGAEAYEKVNVKYDGQIICERRGSWMIDSLQIKMRMN